jgi:uncharacterized protein YhaN
LRILRLDLERYGAFENRSLAFRPDARLHVVYGPNEAGKTSALAAVSDLLFGFGARTDYAFRHDMKDLRLGAVLGAADGGQFSFRRRKGAKATLIDSADAPLRDDALAPFLGGLTREVFGRAFGLDARTLREGAKDLLEADGEAGASLLAAASGLRGLQDLRRSLDGEADEIFAPQARIKRFNQIMQRYEAARRSVRERELRSGDWKALNARIDELAGQLKQLGERRGAAITAHARLTRLGRAAPAAAAVDAARRALVAFDDLPELAPAIAQELRDRLDAAEAASGAAERAASAYEAAVEEHDRTAVDDAACEAAAEIERLLGESGAYAKSQADLPRVQSEAESLGSELAQLAARLGLADGAAVEARLPTDAALATLRELIAEGRALAEAERARERGLAEERDALAGLLAARGHEGAAALDPRPLREAIGALQSEIRQLDRRDEIAAAYEAEMAAIAGAAARLSPPVDALDRLAAAPLPSQEAVARARREQDDLAASLARAGEARSALADEILRVEAELAGLDAGRPIASAETIAEARAARDAVWRGLRAHLVGDSELTGDARREGVAAFEQRSGAADSIADRAAEDAGRAARQADLARRREELLRRLDAADRRVAEAKAEIARAREDWERSWAGAGLRPASPEEMAGWLKSVAALLERRERNAERGAILARLDAGEARLRPELARIAAMAGLPEGDGSGASVLARRIEARIAALADRWERASRTEAQIAEAERRIEKLAREQDHAGAALERWRARWAAALPPVGLGEAATLATAEAAIVAWAEAPRVLRERANRLQRVKGMLRDAEAFRQGVRDLTSAIAADLADLPPETVPKKLNDRLTEARAAATRRAETLRRRDRAAEALEAARRDAEAASAALADAAAALPDGADLRALLDRVAERDRLRADLAAKCEHFLALGEKGDEAALRQELAEYEPDAAKAQIAGFEEEESRLQHEINAAFAELDREQRRRAELEGGVGAEIAALEQRIAAAELAACAREWAVLKLGSLLISAAVERSRAERENPLVVRAAALFGTLTGGAFAGFAEEYGDDDAPRLVARRASGETCPVSGLSEGTRDQFYLALRLAYLEDYAERAEPAPFIGDDLFASFDDERTAQGLQALAQIGAKVQPILFTHHRAVVDIARKTLGDAADIVAFG